MNSYQKNLKTCFCACGVLLTFGLPGAVKAESSFAVLVLRSAASGTQINLPLQDAIADRVAQITEHQYIALDEALVPSIKTLRDQDIADALEASKTGLQALDKLELNNAGGDLDLAVNLLLGYSEFLTKEQSAQLYRSVFALGTVSMFEGKKDTAEAIFVSLALTAPEYSPADDGYAANLVSVYRTLKKNVETREAGSVEITSVPSGALVYVDERFRGVTPLKVEDLVDGQHVVRLKKLGYIPHGTLTPVNGGRNSRIQVDLEPTDAVKRLEEIVSEGGRSSDSLITLGAIADVSKFLFVQEKSRNEVSTTSGFWIDVKERKIVSQYTGLPPSSNPASFATEILTALTLIKPLPLVQAEVSDLAPSSTPFVWPEFTKKWWFWAIVAGTVSAAAVGTSVAVAASDDVAGPPPVGLNQHILGF
ncbi:MAG: PEGA domain-containing protein [Myxococcota bacterium]|nr:PEGA domain-containing protein [Myxococcota bacterium]